MKNRKFVVSWISFFDNIMHSEIVKATSDIDAVFKSSQDIVLLDEEFRSCEIEDIKQLFFDCDAMINTIEI